MKTKCMYVILAVWLVGSQVTLAAQTGDKKEKRQRPTTEQMQQKQAEHMVKALMLDDATAAKFTPLYEKYLKELRECRMMNHSPRVKKEEAQPQGAEAQKPAMTDADIAKQIKGRFAQSRKALDIREKYYNDFSKVLSQKQIQKIYQMEQTYADKFKKEFDRRKGQRDGQGQFGQGKRQGAQQRPLQGQDH